MFTKKELPILSFITPNYNDGNTIEKMVASIADQDYPNIEHIIVDDGSTDNSKEVLKKLEKKYPKLRVIYLDKNEGACIARNLGAKEAKGKYLSFLPADATLYPGMARVWVETLEANPEYDFVYGGYKFVDEEGHEVFSYMSDAFDPYFLKISNYIDGSFPLKKELFDKMGGWDPNIKSLQDWDLWLNAVIRHNAKGLFSQQIFFETTMPHPGGLSDDSHRNWIERTSTIKKKYGIIQPKICVTGPGASFHAKNVAKLLGADYLPNPAFKPNKYEMIYIIGFFGNIREVLRNTNALRVLHWIGSDILALQRATPEVREQTIAWLDNNIDVHLAEIEATQKELADMGIKSKVVPFPPKTMNEPKPLPEKFAIASYLPFNNSAFYYPDFIYAVAKEMPDVNFYCFGDASKMDKNENVEHLGVCNPEEIQDTINKTSLILRLTPHDGLPLSVIEWITAGRHAITTIDIPYSNQFVFENYKGKDKPTDEQINKVIESNKKRLVKLINSLKNKPVDSKAAGFYKDLCSEEKFNKNIKGLLEIDLNNWWNNIAPLWPRMESNQEDTSDIGKIIKEVKLLKPKTVIDLGCGTGRWGDLLPVDNYTGLDFSKELITLAKKDHPDKNFIVSDIKNYVPEKKYDIAFSFASLLHIKPEEMEGYAKALSKIAKKAVFVEPQQEAATGEERVVHPEIIKMQKQSDFIFNVKYTWIHDYMKYFKVEKVISMSNGRKMFIINL